MITLLKFIKDNPNLDTLYVTGLEESALSFCLFKTLEQLPEKNSLVICPDEETCLSVLDHFKTFILTQGNQNFKDSLFFYPQLSEDPTSPIHISLKNIYSRVRVISSLCHSNQPKIIISTLNALQQAIPHLSFFKNYCTSLKVGESLPSRETFIQKCLDSGYLRVDTVIDPGTFSVRGEIIDLFSPQLNHPIRVEFFDTEVEKIRYFNPEDQLTFETTPEIKEAFIIPARESFIPQNSIQNVRNEIKKIGDHNSIHRSIRDPLLESIQPGTQLETSHFWSPFISKNCVSFSEQFHFNNLFFVNEYSCFEKWNSFKDQYENQYLTSLNEGRFLPSFENLFSNFDLIENKRLKDKIKKINFEKIIISTEIKEEKNVIQIESEKNLIFYTFKNDLDKISEYLKKKIKEKYQIYFFCSTESQRDRIQFLLNERKISIQSENFFLQSLSNGFSLPAEKLIFITDFEFFSVDRKIKKRSNQNESSKKSWNEIQALTHLKPDDIIIHRDHGIGKYLGMTKLTLNQIENEYLTLEYEGKDKLYLPVYRVNIIQKYTSNHSDESVILDRLGSKNFEEKKKKVVESVKKLAINLISLYAERKLKKGPLFLSSEEDFEAFERKFPYEETPDQLKAVSQILKDFEGGSVMDRLICGDVGFGKTEIAIRAAFKAVSSGYQVAILVPTTILCFQHEASFKQRMKDYPFIIESLSRFKSNKEQKEILENLKQGKIDILIGTHRLLSKDISFQKLGLLIIDEEHRFGVEHKEKLKQLKVNTHVLTMTATPIPRTLHMALSGMREISLISTPPVDRLPIQTKISKFDDSLIKSAIEFELSRDGQVYFIHNNIETIYSIAEKISKLVPQAIVDVGHARMSEGELEKVVTRFYEKKSNVLVSTTIVESGIDIPNANTIFINNADHFGLSQLYQIRGRVGRSQNRAYAYLLINKHKEISEHATNRLQIIQKFVDLGSGFNIASHDLELRGGGNIIGPEQSGHIHAVGYEMYLDLLEKEISQLKGKKEETSEEPEIKIPFSAYISENYIKDSNQRLNIYRRLSASQNDDELNALESELQNRFGLLPEETLHLLWLIRIKMKLKNFNLNALTMTAHKIVLSPGLNCKLDPIKAIKLVSKNPQTYQFTSDSKFIFNVKVLSIKDLFFTLEKCLNELQ